MNCFETMTCDSEQVVNQAVDREKSLPLCGRFEATHLSFPFPGVLVTDFSSIVFVLRGSMCDGWKDLSVRSRIGPELDRHHVAPATKASTNHYHHTPSAAA